MSTRLRAADEANLAALRRYLPGVGEAELLRLGLHALAHRLKVDLVPLDEDA